LQYVIFLSALSLPSSLLILLPPLRSILFPTRRSSDLMNHLGDYDVIVIGAGHAGIEAAHAAAVMGARTAVFTMSLDAVGNMPCKDRKSTRLNSSHVSISYAVFCLNKQRKQQAYTRLYV